MSDNPDHGVWSSDRLPSSWVWVSFSDFWRDFTSSQKKLPQQSYQSRGKFPVIDQGQDPIGGYSDAVNLLSDAEPPAIVFGDHTRVCKLVETLFIQGADGVRVLKPTAGVAAKYAYYALNTIQLPDKGYSRHFKFLKASQFPLAPESEQRRIVARLENLTARSSRARSELDRIPQLIEQYKQAILRKIFARLPQEKFQPLSQVSEFVTSGSRGWAKYYSTTGALFIRVGNVRRNDVALDLGDPQFVSPPKSAEGVRTRVKPNDIVITITADLGRVGIIPEDFDEAYVNQHVALVRLKDTTQAKAIAWYLSSPNGQEALKTNDRGMTRSGVGLDDIRSILVPDLSKTESDNILKMLESSISWLGKMVLEFHRADFLFSKLDEAFLAKAFRGELVPQDPNDEPASVLLERIKKDAAKGPSKARRGAKRK